MEKGGGGCDDVTQQHHEVSLGQRAPKLQQFGVLDAPGWSLASQSMQSRQLLSGLKLLVRAVFKTTGWVKMLSLALAGFELTGPKLP